MSTLLPCPREKMAFNLNSSMRAHTLSKYQFVLSKQRTFYCNATSSSATVPSLDKNDFLKLQNGSDIRGVAVTGVEGEPVSLPEPVTEAIAAAFGQWLLHKKKAESRRLRVSVGHDSRISAQTLLEAVSRGLGVSGLDVVQFGLASTPAMFNSTLTEDESFLCPADGAIMITASHLPYNRNGFKFFTSDGGLGKVDIKNILERAADIYKKLSDENLRKSQRESSSITKVDYMSVYTSGLVKAVRKAAGDLEKPLEGFHIVVDAGNGAGGFFAAKVLEPLGAITSGSQFLEPDGMFPNHIPNPEDKAAMEAITKAVLDNKADLGIIFDTDVDRSAAVDSSGREFNRNRLIALLSAIVLEEHPGTTIVTDSVTSDGLTSFIEKKLGGKHHRFKRGYKNVIDEAIRLNSVGEESHLAIETSGHGALKENHWLDDGAYLMVKILNKLAAARAAGQGSGSKVLTDLVEGLEEPKVALELRLKIDKNHPDLEGSDFREYGEKVLQHVSNSIETNPNLIIAPVNYEGIRVSGFGGWFLLRLSLHDPVLPLNIEVNICIKLNLVSVSKLSLEFFNWTQAQSEDDAVKLGLVVATTVKEFNALDTCALSNLTHSS
jgi:phosphomannomutase